MTWKGFLIGFVLGLIVVPLFASLYLSLGYAPVATAASPIPFEAYLAKKALDARISREAPQNDPGQPTEATFLAGAKFYREDCAVCHGLPDQPQTEIAKGMFPKPPQLFKGKGVTDDPAGETFWKVKNGIRLTGMPSFGGSKTDEQIWQISELLAKADKLPESVQRELRRAN
jgi:thiosulfate dehydrogenase